MASESYTAIVTASGTALITIAPRNQLVTWRVTQVSAQQATAPIGAVCTLAHNGGFVSYLVATGDVADGNPPLDVIPGDTLTVTWTGCTPGAVASATAFYEVLP